MPWRRKIEAGGAWWAQAGDGSWSRWDGVRGDWVSEVSGPPGGATALGAPGAVYTPLHPGPTARNVAVEFASMWGGLMLPGLLTVGLAFLVMVPLGFLWNVFFAPWLGDPIRIGPTLLFVLGALVAVTLCLAVGGTLIRASRRLELKLAGVAVLVAGPLVTLFVVARMLRTGLSELMRRPGTILTAFLILAGYGAAWWIRFRRED